MSSTSYAKKWLIIGAHRTIRSGHWTHVAHNRSIRCVLTHWKYSRCAGGGGLIRLTGFDINTTFLFGHICIPRVESDIYVGMPKRVQSNCIPCGGVHRPTHSLWNDLLCSHMGEKIRLGGAGEAKSRSHTQLWWYLVNFKVTLHVWKGLLFLTETTQHII